MWADGNIVAAQCPHHVSGELGDKDFMTPPTQNVTSWKKQESVEATIEESAPSKLGSILVWPGFHRRVVASEC